MPVPTRKPLPIETAWLKALRELAADRYGNLSVAEDFVLYLAASTLDNKPKEAKFRLEVSAAFLRWLLPKRTSANGREREAEIYRLAAVSPSNAF